MRAKVHPCRHLSHVPRVLGDAPGWALKGPILMSNPTHRSRRAVSFGASVGIALIVVNVAPAGGALASERPSPPHTSSIGSAAAYSPGSHPARADATFLVSPERGRPGKNIKLTGYDYGAAESVTITFIDSTTGRTVLGTFPTDAGGGFVGVVRIPKDATHGRQKVLAKGTTSRIRDAAWFEVR